MLVTKYRDFRPACQVRSGGALLSCCPCGSSSNWVWLACPSTIFVAGFAIASGLTRHPLARGIAGAIGVFVGVWIAWIAYQNFWTSDPLIAFKGDDQGLDIALAVFLALAVGLIT